MCFKLSFFFSYYVLAYVFVWLHIDYIIYSISLRSLFIYLFIVPLASYVRIGHFTIQSACCVSVRTADQSQGEIRIRSDNG